MWNLLLVDSATWQQKVVLQGASGRFGHIPQKTSSHCLVLCIRTTDAKISQSSCAIEMVKVLGIGPHGAVPLVDLEPVTAPNVDCSNSCLNCFKHQSRRLLL